MNSGYRRTQITTLSQKKTYIQGKFIYVYCIYKVVISVCLFICSIITHEPLDRFASHFYRETWSSRTTGMFLVRFRNPK